ncbi:pyrroloquinoline quinone biosynthesis protein PqqF [Pseudomonas sp. Ant30-3]|uniref:pyrroloquinoline quinone biosynthesis protein PqqF n=1 Tax=Pseudomonas sp. Ant30-3 TaxID=1488328 RepID=UPI00048DADD5|nr:pyrroloquinoline quinone biosynthesis protein PqqF [Pseudomonas sp. Ant30-3]
MPALNAPHLFTETLANGLRLTLRHAPELKRCAAALRVAAGSHDVPLAWPGLAHFLEHLLFLGTERFPADQALMAYVQRHGGQVNARTSERTTDFFFELSPQAFSGGLERLSDMLAHPRMKLQDQQREREVLQAEFVAWSGDAGQQQQQSLFNGLSTSHPLRGFHAGNRDSLPVDLPEFQQALKAFHQRFYQTGQMTLSLAGPQSIEELKRLAMVFSDTIPVAEHAPQSTPALLMKDADSGYQQVDARGLNLLFPMEALPQSSPEALAFLCHWLNTDKPGSLLTELRARGLAEQLHARPLYQFAGQALLHIQFTLPGDAAAPAIAELLLDWLGFFAAQEDWSAMRDEFARVQQRQRQVSSALNLAQWDCAQLEDDLSAHAVVALNTVLKQIGAVDNFTGPWQLPPPNPFLQAEPEAPSAGLIRGQTSKHRGLRTFAQDRLRNRRERSSMQFSQALPDNTVEGAVYLRWQLESAPSDNLQAHLEKRLRPLTADARQAGVDFSFSASGNEWLLKMTGLQEPMPIVLEHALKELKSAETGVVQQASISPPLIPIRHLLKALPEHCLARCEVSDDLQKLWSTAHWVGLATGMSSQTQAAMSVALSRVPGTANGEPTSMPSMGGCKVWSTVETGSSEHAVLLFCPTASHDLADEAAWRLLAHFSQTPFYQRLRVELQLGYAVFSGLRQIHGMTGLLFGVQSPKVEPSELMEHFEQFFLGLQPLIEGMDEVTFVERRRALAEQFDCSVLPSGTAAELIWQSKLAGRSSDYLTELPLAILTAERRELVSAVQRLNSAAGGWHCLATGPAPSAEWHARK